MFGITKEIIGSKQNLLFFDGKYQFSSSIPSNYWIFCGDKENNQYENNLDALLACNGIEPICFEIPLKYQKALKQVSKIGKKNVPWQLMLPTGDYVKCLNAFVQRVFKTILEAEQDYYLKIFKPSLNSFKRLGHAKVDINTLNSVKNGKVVNSSVFSFNPDLNGIIEKVVYNRFATRTGRLTVKSGHPQILLLPKENRNIFISKFEGGQIFQLDYSSLETRFAFILSGKENLKADIYQQISDDLLNHFTRKQVKIATLAILFGMGNQSMSKLLNLSGNELYKIVDKLRGYFNIEYIIQDLKRTKIVANNKLKNFYGRIIDIPLNAPDYIILNSYIQSTCVDISLLGFSKIIEYIKEQNLKIEPTFIIHDALIMDVHPAELNKLNDLIQIGSDALNLREKFVLKQEKLVS